MTVSGLGTSYAYLQSTSVTGTSATRPATSTTAVAGANGSSSRVPGHITAAAKVLGLSVSEITKALSSGSSLAHLAKKQGVSRDDLVAALVAGAPDDIKATGDVATMVNSLVDQTGMGGPAGGPPPAKSSGVLGASLTSTQNDMPDALSRLLSTDSTSLLEKLRSGASLNDLLSNAGVTTQDLAGVVENGLLIDTTT